jgi:hypothetical protein
MEARLDLAGSLRREGVSEMNLDEFLRSLQRLSASEIIKVAAGVREERAGDDLAWWQATLALEHSVRRQQRSVGAAAAATTAARQLVTAASHDGLAADAADVADAARSAAEVARTLVAEDAAADPCYFFRGWERIIDIPPWAACGEGQAA